MALDLDSLLARHDRVWMGRVEVLEHWHEVQARREETGRRLARRLRAREAELVRVSQGLSARQRTWAARHSTYESRPTDRAGRQVVVSWIYRRKHIEAAEAKWAVRLTPACQALAEAEVSLAIASRDVLEAWETQAPRLTGVSRRGLQLLARRAQTELPDD